MLKILNNLEPFFRDCYKRVNVRAYARLKNLSPPTASKILQYYHKKRLLKKEIAEQRHYYFANKESITFRKFSIIYWQRHLKSMLDHIEKETLSPVIVLFGSFSKAEVHPQSDLDLAVFTPTEKRVSLEAFEKKIKRDIQLFMFKGRDNIENKKLLDSILNGEKLRGSW